jgi:hypothetical protein
VSEESPTTDFGGIDGLEIVAVPVPGPDRDEDAGIDTDTT